MGRAVTALDVCRKAMIECHSKLLRLFEERRRRMPYGAGCRVGGMVADASYRLDEIDARSSLCMAISFYATWLRKGHAMQMLIREIRYALRQSSNYSGFTHTVVDTMGISIGANTAMLTASESVRSRRLLSERPQRM